MTGAHARLSSLWDALEAQGAHVQRLPLDTITARTANRLASREEYRLRVLAEEYAPVPLPRPHNPNQRLEDVLALVHHAMTTEGAA